MVEAMHDLELKDATVAIQGFGNVGSYAGLGCWERGLKVAAVSDVFGGIYNDQGINIEGLNRHVHEKGSVVGFSGADPLVEDIISYPCDILLPCALDGAIREDNADTVKAQLIVEGANGPVTLAADAILEKQGVQIIPDILANSGGVIVSYYETVQNRQGFYWEEKEVNERLLKLITQAYYRVRDMARKQKSDFRKASYYLAMEKIARAIVMRGAQ